MWDIIGATLFTLYYLSVLLKNKNIGKNGLKKDQGIGEEPMLRTRQERVKLLKAGIFGKTIERLYITHNNFKIMGNPILEMIEINTHKIKDIALNQEATAELSF